ncbi:MAG TPA: hypothetical protein VEC60_05640 [Reyranella sp.]|nr:hypothetical protein [Reyranella sp.]
MARSPHGSRRALPWAVAQRARPLPRVVRLARAANDNSRLPALPTRMIVLSVLLALAALAVVERLL